MLLNLFSWIPWLQLTFATTVPSPRPPLWFGAMLPLYDNASRPLVLGQQLAAAFRLAVQDAQLLLPNRTLRYAIFPIQPTFVTTVYTTEALLAVAPKNASWAGVVAGLADADTDPISNVLTDEHVLQCVYGTSNPVFSDNDVYPNIVRMLPNDGVQGAIFADVLFGHYGFRRVVVVHATSPYGTIMYNYFVNAALHRGIPLLATIDVNDGQTFDIAYQLEALRPLDPRVFVVMMDDLPTAASVLEIGYDLGILNPQTFLWGSDTLLTPKLLEEFSTVAKGREVLAAVGLVGVKYDVAQWMAKPHATGFVARLRAAAVGGGAAPMSPLTAYVYDGVLAMARGYRNRPLAASAFQAVKQGVIYLPPFVGVSQTINFTTQVSFMHDYGSGDMVASGGFDVWSYQTVGTHPERFYRVGNWSQGGGLVLCAADMDSCVAIHYGTPDNVPLSDRAPPVYLAPSPALVGVYSVYGVLLIAGTAFVYGVLWRYRHNKILKLCQLPVLVAMNACTVFGMLRIFVSVPHALTPAVCLARTWMGHLNYTVIVALLVKTYRTHVIVNNKTLKKLKFSLAKTALCFGGLTGAMIVCLGVMTAVNRPEVSDRVTVLLTGQAIHDVACRSPRPEFDYVLYAYEGVILVVVGKLCNDIRNTFDAINESKSIAMCVGVLFVLTMGGFALTSALDLTGVMSDIIVVTLFFLCNATVLATYFGPKCVLVLSGADLDGKLKLVYHGEAHQTEAHKSHHDNTVRDMYLKAMPGTPKDCQDLIALLQERVLAINMKGAMSSHSSLSESHQHSEFNAELPSELLASLPTPITVQVVPI